MLESYVLDSTATRHDMDSLALKYLNHTTTEFPGHCRQRRQTADFRPDLTGTGRALRRRRRRRDAAPAPDPAGKAGNATPSLSKVLSDIEMPLVPVLARIERQGALVDANLLGIQSVELGEKMVALEREAFAIAGEEFNLGSPKQLGVILYEKLGLPILSKTAKGQAFDRRSGAGGTGRAGLPAAQGADAVPLDEQAEKHLHRSSAGADQPAHRAHSHLLPSGSGGDRAFVVQRSEPAEHPDPYRRRPSDSSGVRRAKRLQAAGGGLLADRTADHGAPGQGRRLAARLPQ